MNRAPENLVLEWSSCRNDRTCARNGSWGTRLEMSSLATCSLCLCHFWLSFNSVTEKIKDVSFRLLVHCPNYYRISSFFKIILKRPADPLNSYGPLAQTSGKIQTAKMPKQRTQIKFVVIGQVDEAQPATFTNVPQEVKVLTLTPVPVSWDWIDVNVLDCSYLP